MPLRDESYGQRTADAGSVDVAVFCLALMGTDYPSFLLEAARVLKPHGIIWIAEVCPTAAVRPHVWRLSPEACAQHDCCH